MRSSFYVVFCEAVCVVRRVFQWNVQAKRKSSMWGLLSSPAAVYEAEKHLNSTSSSSESPFLSGVGVLMDVCWIDSDAIPLMRRSIELWGVTKICSAAQIRHCALVRILDVQSTHSHQEACNTHTHTHTHAFQTNDPFLLSSILFICILSKFTWLSL